jgi:hypothetical protein
LGESTDLARAFAAVGNRAKAGKILDGYAVIHGGTVNGIARVVAKYAELGFDRGLVKGLTRRLPLEKLVALAEARLDPADRLRHLDFGPLAIARACVGSIAPAIEHALAITDLDSRASILAAVAETVRGRRFDATSDVTVAIARLKAEL